MIPDISQSPQSAPPDRAPLVVWQSPAGTNAAVLAQLQTLAAGNGMLLEMHEQMETAAAALQASPEAMLVLVVPTAHEDLAQGMAAGQMPAALLEGWRTRASAVLDLRRSDRRRCLLITPQAAVLWPAALCTRLGVQTSPQATPPSLPPGDPVLTLLALHAIDSDAGAHSLARELNASLLHQDNAGATPTLDAALHHYRDRQTREIEELNAQLLCAQGDAEIQYQRTENLAGMSDAHTQELAQLSDAHTQELAQLSDAHTQELAQLSDAHTQELAQLSDAHTQELVQLSDAHTQELVQLSDARDAAQAETEIFLIQLAAVQDACDQAEAQVRRMETHHAALITDKNAKLRRLSERKKKSDAEQGALRQQVEQLEQNAHQLEQEKHQLEQNAHQLEKEKQQLEQQRHQLAQGLESHQALLQETEAARHTLREQLAQMHDAYADLEGHFTQAEALQDTLNQREAALVEASGKATHFERQTQRLEKRIATLDKKFRTHQAQIAERETRIAALDARLSHILKSPGYRLTAALRALFGQSSRDA